MAVVSLVAVGCGGGEETTKEPPSTATCSDGIVRVGAFSERAGEPTGTTVGIELAVEDINAAGGVDRHDSTTVPPEGATATAEIESLGSEGALAVIGSSEATPTERVSSLIVEDGEMAHLVTTPTADRVAADIDGRFEFLPPDFLQAQVLADLLAGDGLTDIHILVADGSDHRRALGDAIAAATATPPEQVTVYNPDFFPPAADIAAGAPQAIVLVTDEVTPDALRSLDAARVAPSDLPVFASAGSVEFLRTSAPEGTEFAQRLRGVSEGAALVAALAERVAENGTGNDNGLRWAAEAYDAATVLALAVVAADSDCVDDVVPLIAGLTTDGEVCTDFEGCAQAIRAGADIDYDGQSGAIEFDEHGVRSAGTFGIVVFDDDGALDPTSTVYKSVNAEAG